MATTKRALRHARRSELTLEQELSLIVGGMDGFQTATEYESGWWSHRDELLAAVNKCTRPAAWWILEFKGVQLPHEQEWQTLARYKLLTAEEEWLVEKWNLQEFAERAAAYRARIVENEKGEISK